MRVSTFRPYLWPKKWFVDYWDNWRPSTSWHSWCGNLWRLLHSLHQDPVQRQLWRQCVHPILQEQDQAKPTIFISISFFSKVRKKSLYSPRDLNDRFGNWSAHWQFLWNHRGRLSFENQCFSSMKQSNMKLWKIPPARKEKRNFTSYFSSRKLGQHKNFTISQVARYEFIMLLVNSMPTTWQKSPFFRVMMNCHYILHTTT